MGNRKLAENSNVDFLPAISEVYGDQVMKHRSCWMHIAGYQLACGKRITRQKIEDIKRFERISPCFLGTFPHRKRSTRRVNHKKKLSKQNNKLNSYTFEFYLDYIWRSLPESRRNSFIRFDSLWFSLYLKESCKEKVLKWIKKRQIFSKKYVLVPIVCWSHWRLLIFCHFGESLQSKTTTSCMLLLDSLQMADPKGLEPYIRKFVLDIYRAEDRPESKEFISQIPLFVPKVPQQITGEECGKFVLYFIHLFVEEAPENFSIVHGYPYFMKQNWFTHDNLEQFCKQFDYLEN